MFRTPERNWEVGIGLGVKVSQKANLSRQWFVRKIKVAGLGPGLSFFHICFSRFRAQIYSLGFFRLCCQCFYFNSLWKRCDVNDLTSQLSCSHWSRKDLLGTLRCLALGTEEMTGILQRGMKEGEGRAPLTGDETLRKTQQGSVRTQLVQAACRAGPGPGLLWGWHWLDQAARSRGLKPGALITDCNTTFQKGYCSLCH